MIDDRPPNIGWNWPVRFRSFGPFVFACALFGAAVIGCARTSSPAPTATSAPLAAIAPTLAPPTATTVPTATPVPPATSTPVASPTPVPPSPTTRPTVTATSTPIGALGAIGVMIDNDPHARPQTGLNAADVVYEMPAEFNLTRFLAVFFANAPTEVGSIRSTRPYFAMAMTEYGGGLAHCLDVPGVPAVLQQGAVFDFDLCRGSGEEAAIRTSQRAAPFNLYVNAHLLQSELRLRPPRRAAALLPRASLAAAAPPATAATIVYPEGHRVVWTWNGDNYLREQDGAPHLESDGRTVSSDVIVIQRAVTQPTRYFGDAGYHIVDLIGSGPGLILANGKSEPVRWSRSSESQPTTFLDSAGHIVALPPGRIFIEVLPTNGTVNLQP
ncbi:MAG TPA: DUF3048 domain-containing protein [Chloroflexota bacterium]|nr:DUF3048 domain-containing protein [Chloroflexota bacterium]